MTASVEAALEEFTKTYPNLYELYKLAMNRAASNYQAKTPRGMMAWLNSTMEHVLRNNLAYDEWDESLPAEVAEKAHQEWLKAREDLKLVPK